MTAVKEFAVLFYFYPFHVQLTAFLPVETTIFSRTNKRECQSVKDEYILL